jgi:hypothetical protein
VDPTNYARLLKALYMRTVGATNTNAMAATATNAVARPATQRPATQVSAHGATVPNRPGRVEKGGQLLIGGGSPGNPSAPTAVSQNPSFAATSKNPVPATATATTNTATADVPPIVAEPTQEEMEAGLVATIQVSPDDLRALVLARVHSVQAALVNTGKVEGERVTVRSPQPISPDAHGQARANLALQ